MKKNFLIILILALLLTGCATKKTEYKENNKKYWDKFTVVEDYYNASYGSLNVVYDNDTKVMYYIVHDGYKFGITPIYNSDGTIMIYNKVDK